MFKNREARIRFVKTDDASDDAASTITTKIVNFDLSKIEKTAIRVLMAGAGAVAAVKVIDAGCYIAVKHLEPSDK